MTLGHLHLRHDGGSAQPSRQCHAVRRAGRVLRPDLREKEWHASILLQEVLYQICCKPRLQQLTPFNSPYREKLLLADVTRLCSALRGDPVAVSRLTPFCAQDVNLFSFQIKATHKSARHGFGQHHRAPPVRVPVPQQVRLDAPRLHWRAGLIFHISTVAFTCFASCATHAALLACRLQQTGSGSRQRPTPPCFESPLCRLRAAARRS